MTHIITLEQDPETGDLILPLSEEILTAVDWREGDTIEWIDNKDGSWTMKKVLVPNVDITNQNIFKKETI